MARYLSNINLTGNQLQNAALHPTRTAPSNPVEGQVYFNTGSNKLFIYDGSAWVDISGDITSIKSNNFDLSSVKVINLSPKSSFTKFF